MNNVTPTLDTPAVNPTYLRLLCHTLRNQGVDPEPILLEAGLGPLQALLTRETPVTHRAVNHLIHAALRISGDPALGLHLGMAVQISAHGAMGYALVASSTLRQALEVMVRYAPLRHAAIRFRLRETGQGAAFELIERIDLESGHEFVTTLIFGAVVILLQSVVGNELNQVSVDLPFPEPAWRSEIATMFRGQLRFDSRQLTFYLSHALLDYPCITADPAAFAQATMECERQMAALQGPVDAFAQRVRELLVGRESDYPTIPEAAQFFSMSARTLMRKLDSEGTSFQALLDEARAARARQYLLLTNLTVEEIAHRLGYQNTSNFSKTFRRWFNATPSEFRAAGR
ncbi:AraC-like DNA-binding protein [Oxalobacteraceae bacterium GrIS 2.11]